MRSENGLFTGLLSPWPPTGIGAKGFSGGGGGGKDHVIKSLLNTLMRFLSRERRCVGFFPPDDR